MALVRVDALQSDPVALTRAAPRHPRGPACEPVTAKSYSPRVPALAHTTRHNRATLSTPVHTEEPPEVGAPRRVRAAGGARGAPAEPMIGWAATRGILRPRSAALPSDTTRLPKAAAHVSLEGAGGRERTRSSCRRACRRQSTGSSRCTPSAARRFSSTRVKRHRPAISCGGGCRAAPARRGRLSGDVEVEILTRCATFSAFCPRTRASRPRRTR